MTTRNGLLNNMKITKRKIDMKPEDNTSNMKNANKGTPGTNRQYDQNQGARGKDLNPNQKGKK